MLLLINACNRVIPAIIINSEQTVFHDRYNVSDGKKWYYKLEIENQYGESEFSDIKTGATRP